MELASELSVASAALRPAKRRNNQLQWDNHWQWDTRSCSAHTSGHLFTQTAKCLPLYSAHTQA